MHLDLMKPIIFYKKMNILKLNIVNIKHGLQFQHLEQIMKIAERLLSMKLQKEQIVI